MENSPINVKNLRIKIGFTQKKCADLFGVSLRSWQKREEFETVNSIKMSKFEFEYLLLLAGEHPDYLLVERKK